MKYLFALVFIAVLTFVFRNVLTKRDRRRAVRSVTAWIIPALVGLTAVVALLFFNLNFNGKII